MGFKAAKAYHLRIGRAGENTAARFLESEGIEVLARNCRYPKGELDIVARDGRCLVFVEVKSRRRKKHEDIPRPLDALRPDQKRRIYRAAFTYMKDIGNPPIPFRFDVIEVIFGTFGVSHIRHWRSNFGSESLKRGQH